MTHWDTKSIFAEAVENHAPGDWPALLDRLCTDDQVRSRVERLLRAHQRCDSLPDATAGLPGDTGLLEQPGSTIDHYHLVRQLGEGGFGVVFLAEQSQSVRREVALKVIKPGMDTRQVIARFDAEKQVRVRKAEVRVQEDYVEA